MKNRSSRKFRMIGTQKAMRKAFRTDARKDRQLTQQRSDAMLVGHELIENFLSRGKQVVVHCV